MSQESPESDVTGSMNFEDTELTLGLPGENRSAAATEGQNCGKRGLMENSESQVSGGTRKFPAVKRAQVIGWPPVRSYRQKEIEKSGCSSKLVKVAVDGAPYLRKVDLQIYSSYQHLFKAFEDLFTCFTVRRDYVEVMGPKKGMEYVATYEDKDDDWMLVGDVPWKMFVESCKRIRLMRSAEAMGFARRTQTNCSSTS
ncbi:Auxin-responsive protein [Melia azedarach]|uniref:Auxin-responsive protein n=1 Tax=Melia azedarach TaxID=155640 RepID=A0ACC1XB09_MELAZ|nr:Auxin-responsive protein [Melia azedarach]